MIRIPRDRLDDVWGQHMSLVLDPNRALLLERLGEDLARISNAIENNEKMRTALSARLFNVEWIKQNHLSWAGVRGVKSLLHVEESQFIGLLKQYLVQLEKEDPYLAGMIRAEFSKRSNEGITPELIELRGILRTRAKPLRVASLLYKDRVKWSALKQGGSYLEQARLAIEQILEKYVGLVVIKQYLPSKFSRLTQDQPLPIFNEQLRLFLEILRKRGATTLWERIKNSRAVKHALFLQEELKYLGSDIYYSYREGKQRMGLLKMIEVGENEGNWEHFNSFYDSLGKESHELVEWFGDKDAKNRLLKFKKKRHKWLLGWKSELNTIIKLLESHAYQNEIMQSARLGIWQDLSKYFINTQKKVAHQIKEILTLLKKIVKERTKHVTKRDVTQLLKIRERVLLRELKDAQNKFAAQEQVAFDLWQEASLTEKQISQTDKTLKKVSTISVLCDSKVKWTDYVAKTLGVVSGAMRRAKDAEEMYAYKLFKILERVVTSSNILGGIEDKQKLTEIELIRNLQERLMSKGGALHLLIDKLRTYHESLRRLNEFLRDATGIASKRVQESRVVVYGRR